MAASTNTTRAGAVGLGQSCNWGQNTSSELAISSFLETWFIIHIVQYASLTYNSEISITQDVMFRELRKPKGDPKILAAQSREQYLKVLVSNYST